MKRIELPSGYTIKGTQVLHKHTGVAVPDLSWDPETKKYSSGSANGIKQNKLDEIIYQFEQNRGIGEKLAATTTTTTEAQEKKVQAFQTFLKERKEELIKAKEDLLNQLTQEDLPSKAGQFISSVYDNLIAIITRAQDRINEASSLDEKLKLIKDDNFQRKLKQQSTVFKQKFQDLIRSLNTTSQIIVKLERVEKAFKKIRDSLVGLLPESECSEFTSAGFKKAMIEFQKSVKIAREKLNLVELLKYILLSVNERLLHFPF